MKVKRQINKDHQPEYADLTIGRVYAVIGIEANEYRLLNDVSQPYLYPPHLFEMIDDTIPLDWEIEWGEEGEQYAYPPELNRIGFFEDYFDGEVEAIVTFHRYLQKQSAQRKLAISE